MRESIVQVIKNRRSVFRFKSTPIDDETIQEILETARWAPSWLNQQPWRFIVIRDFAIKQQIIECAPVIFHQGISEAPVTIAVVVNTEDDSFHFIEAGAVATQNMALTAQSLGFSSCWIGVFNLNNAKDSTEERIKQILNVPPKYRWISLLPIGMPRFVNKEKQRKPLHDLVYENTMLVTNS